MSIDVIMSEVAACGLVNRLAVCGAMVEWY